MKKLFSLAICLIVVFFIAAFTNMPSSNGTKDLSADLKLSPLAYKIMESTYLWNLLIQTHPINKETDATWLEVGLRSKYAVAKRYAALSLIENAAGVKVFNEGPHKGELNFNSNDDFGHYNPAFLKILKESLHAVFQNAEFREMARQVYQQHFRSMAHTYRGAYQYMLEHPEDKENIQLYYEEIIAQPEGSIEGSLQELFRSYADEVAQNEGADWYEAVSAPSFWIRRSLDGTAEQFASILNLVINELEEGRKKK